MKVIHAARGYQEAFSGQEKNCIKRFFSRYRPVPRACEPSKRIPLLGWRRVLRSVFATALLFPGAASGGPWVWEVSGRNGVLWLAGSIHFVAASDAVAASKYDGYYRGARVVYFESLPGAWETFEARRAVTTAGMLPVGATLLGEVSTHTRAQLEAVLAFRPGELRVISHMRPWLAAYRLTQDSLAHAGFSRDASLEVSLQREALKDGKPIGGLESGADEIAALAETPVSAQDEFLRLTAFQLNRMPVSVRNISAAWSSGDADRLLALLNAGPIPPESAVYHSLITARNRRWQTKIERLLDEGGGALVVVGVEHLICPRESLPSLLEKAGCKVRRVP